MSLLLRPSAAYMWMNCLGYVPKARSLGIGAKEATDAMAKGTEAHSWAAKLFKKEVRESDVPEEFREHLTDYVLRCDDYARRVGDESGGSCEETLISLPGIETGTPDFVAVGPKGIAVLDLKWAPNIEYNAVNNWQILIYAMSAGAFVEEGDVILGIHQPVHRTGPLNTEWKFPVSDLKQYYSQVTQRLSEIDALDDTSPEMFTVGDHCDFCELRAKGLCPAINEKFSQELLPAEAREWSVDNLSPERLLLLVKNAKHFEKVLKAAFARATSLAARGELEGAYIGVGRKGNRQWADQKKAARKARAIAKALGKDITSLFEPETLLSHSQLKKLGVELPEEFVTRSPGKPKLSYTGSGDLVYDMSAGQPTWEED